MIIPGGQAFYFFIFLLFANTVFFSTMGAQPTQSDWLLAIERVQNKCVNWAWWHTPVTQHSGMTRQQNGKFKPDLDNIVNQK